MYLSESYAYLNIAKKNLEKISSTKNPSGYNVDESVVVIILSAAAVESGLNTCLMFPLLFPSDEKTKLYFVEYAKKYLRSRVTDKINFIKKAYSDSVKLTPQDMSEFNLLFDSRNKLLHSTPEYSEPYSPPEEAFNEADILIPLEHDKEFEKLGWKKNPTLTTEAHLQNSDLERNAGNCFCIAERMLEKLECGLHMFFESNK